MRHVAGGCLGDAGDADVLQRCGRLEKRLVVRRAATQTRASGLSMERLWESMTRKTTRTGPARSRRFPQQRHVRPGPVHWGAGGPPPPLPVRGTALAAAAGNSKRGREDRGREYDTGACRRVYGWSVSYALVAFGAIEEAQRADSHAQRSEDQHRHRQPVKRLCLAHGRILLSGT